MKKIISIIVVTTVLFCTMAHAEYQFAQNWSKQDTAFQATFIVLTMADWAQTRWMAKQDWSWDGDQYHETNFVMGKYPSSNEVDLYMPTAIILHTLIAMALPDELKIANMKIHPRRIWQCIWIGAETYTINNNFALGAKVEF